MQRKEKEDYFSTMENQDDHSSRDKGLDTVAAPERDTPKIKLSADKLIAKKATHQITMVGVNYVSELSVSFEEVLVSLKKF